MEVRRLLSAMSSAVSRSVTLRSVLQSKMAGPGDSSCEVKMQLSQSNPDLRSQIRSQYPPHPASNLRIHFGLNLPLMKLQSELPLVKPQSEVRSPAGSSTPSKLTASPAYKTHPASSHTSYHQCQPAGVRWQEGVRAEASVKRWQQSQPF